MESRIINIFKLCVVKYILKNLKPLQVFNYQHTMDITRVITSYSNNIVQLHAKQGLAVRHFIYKTALEYFAK